jgi:hypothetical protein
VSTASLSMAILGPRMEGVTRSRAAEPGRA